MKDQSLTQIIEQLKQKDTEIRKLKEALGDKGKKKNSSVPEKDNNKLNWAIGLGIAILVVGLLCLVFLSRKRRD